MFHLEPQWLQRRACNRWKVTVVGLLRTNAFWCNFEVKYTFHGIKHTHTHTHTQTFIQCSSKKDKGPNSTTRTPATNIGYGHHQWTSSQQFYNKFATSQCQSPTSRHVKMFRRGKFLSVGGVRSRCTRVVEFGANATLHNSTGYNYCTEKISSR